MAPTPSRWRDQTLGEEIANGITHGIGAAMALVALLYMAIWVAMYGDGWRIAGALVYGSTLFGLYLASTLYHSMRSPWIKAHFRRLDRAAIYLFIAGCYTPFSLVNLRGDWGLPLFGAIWALAVLGVVLEWRLGARFLVASTGLYLLMGWLSVAVAAPMLARVEPAGLAWLLGGGLSYTVGVGFFWWTRLRFHHAIWHVFVLAGSLCHCLLYTSDAAD